MNVQEKRIIETSILFAFLFLTVPLTLFAQKTDEYFEPVELLAHCRHIVFLDESMKGDALPDERDGLVAPEKYQKKIVISALNELPEFVCKSVSRIAFYNVDSGKTLAKVKETHPDLINIYPSALGDIRPTTSVTIGANEYELKVDYEPWPDAMRRIMHEAFHCTMGLIQFQSGNLTPMREHWSPEVKAAAKKIVEDTGLHGGLKEEWERVHEGFRKADLAEPYIDDKRIDDPGQSAEKGFFTYYGRRNAWEEIADMAASILVRSSGLLGGSYGVELPYNGVISAKEDLAQKRNLSDDQIRSITAKYTAHWKNPCLPLRELEQRGVKPEWYAVYTKIMFLVDIGFISMKDYEQCAGSGSELKLRLDHDLTDDGWHRVDFETQKHVVTHKDIRPGFPVNGKGDDTFRILGSGEMEDEGKKYDFDMILEFVDTRKPSIPRGYYPFRGPLIMCSEKWLGAGASFFLLVKDAPSRSFCAVSGNVLITRSSRQFIEGSMYISRIVKYVLLPIPEVPKFKVYIRWKRPGSTACSNSIPCPMN